MRIVHIDCGREMRGGQWQVLRLLRGLRQRGVESILLAGPDCPLGQTACGEGFQVEKPGLRFPAGDLVHAHDARGHAIAAVFARNPVIVARRVAFPVRRGWLSRWKYHRAAHYIAVSRYVADQLNQIGIPDTRITVVHDGVPLLPLSTRDGGVIEVAKSTSNLERDLLHASVLLYLTDAEGLGSAALMGMSAGVPVIASRVGGVPEIIQDGVNGLLIANDPAEGVRAVQSLQSDAEEAARLAANGRRTIEQRFTVEQMIDNTVAVYRKVLNA